MLSNYQHYLQPEKDVIKNIVEIKPYKSICGFLGELRNKHVWLSNNASQALVSLCLQTRQRDTPANKVLFLDWDPWRKVLLEITPVTPVCVASTLTRSRSSKRALFTFFQKIKKKLKTFF
jgi:hypothetical protein